MAEAISPLRRRMIEDMTMRNLAPRTQRQYIDCVKKFSVFLGCSPDRAGGEDVRRYQLHLLDSGLACTSINAQVTALRFFFKITLGRSEILRHLPFLRAARKLPVVLSQPEMARLLQAAPGLKYRAALSVAYAAGLRAAEVVALKVSDIDSERMLLRIEQGKGRKERYALLSPQLLALLRRWWLMERPRIWLFPGQDHLRPMSKRQLNRACDAAVATAGIGKRVSPHTLRHSFATHLLEQNIDIRVIQVLLGHAQVETTALYAQVATKVIRSVTSPFDHLALSPSPPPT